MSEGYHDYAFDVRVTVNAFDEAEAHQLIWEAMRERIDGHLLAAQRQAKITSVRPAALPMEFPIGSITKRFGVISDRQRAMAKPECTCVFDCAEHPPTACSLSGDWHIHPASTGAGFGPCPVHPDAPGDE